MEEKNFNITKHVFVPKHIKLNDEEKQKFLQSQNLNKSQLPLILKEDKAIQDLEPKKGDLIKIIRKSPTSGKSFFYRIVV